MAADFGGWRVGTADAQYTLLMHVTVLLFGPEAALVGRGSVEIELGTRGTCRDVLAGLAEQWPALRASARTARLAINHEFAEPDQPVQLSDELALIGMVSGG